ncbi:hypothetical protein P886_4356 [Alteromonadaceae bacterium 2753L.S.0a.02]|nr:hypothetical protein P886_4356 [Alteromonadaceae bacterium 2753L.S.0a.02]
MNHSKKNGEFEYALQTGENLLLVARRFRVTLNQLLSANPHYRADPEYVRSGDVILVPNAHLEDSLVRFGDFSDNTAQESICCTSDPNTDWLLPEKGLLTFEACGSETRGRQFSRKPHVPDANSGVVIGRGYSLKDRSEQEIFSDLSEACVDVNDARNLASCRHLTGGKARKFLQDMGYNRIEISLESQYRLHQILYSELSGFVKRICRRVDVADKYGTVNWGELPQKFKDIVVDLHYCGDYTSATRERVQPTLVSGKLEDLQHVISDQYYWLELRNVPPERFETRRHFLLANAANQRQTPETA